MTLAGEDARRRPEVVRWSAGEGRSRKPGRWRGDERNNLVGALVSVLRWNANHAPLFHYLNGLQAAIVRLRIQSWGEAGAGLRSRLESLPGPSRDRIELAPEVFRLLYGPRNRPQHEMCDSLERFCDVEAYIGGGATSQRPASTCWSALGDVRMTGARDRDSELPGTYRQTDGLAFAPVVRNIALDGYSPALAAIRSRGQTVEPHSPGEFDAAMAQVSAGLSLVESACAPAAQMLDACLRVVVLARIREDKDKWGSFSSPQRPGQAALLNAHTKVWVSETVADALVHEATHSLIRKVKIARTLVADSARAVKVVSPWTGRQLHVPLFTTACFVWFGLWNFWNRAASNTKRGVRLAQRARRGFRTGSLLDAIPPEARPALAPEAAQALQSMAAEVNASAA